MEASYFYYRPSDLTWAGEKGKWLDKGFNVKFSFKPKQKFLPTLAIGLDDFAGTGYLSREYVMSTFSTKSLKLSAGIGWGKYSSGTKNFKNPLSIISTSFETRGSEYGDDSESLYGGQLTYSSWFSGPVSLLGGIEWSVPYANGLKFKIEHDPFNYNDFSANFRSDRNQILRKSDSNYNFGFAYKINDYTSINLSYIKGNTLSLHFSIGAKTNKPKKKIIKKPKIEKLDKSFYVDLLYNMNKNSSYLQTAQLSEKSLDVAIMNDTFSNPIRTSLHAAEIASTVLQNHKINIDKINITTINVGLEMNKMSFRSDDIIKDDPIIDFKKYNTKLLSGNKKDYLNNDFKPIVRYPKFFNSFSPELITHIGTPNLPFLKGLEISAQSEIQLHRQVSIFSDIRYAVANDFDDKASFPGSELPNVRTEIVRYLQDSDFYVRNLQLDYFWSAPKNIYGKFSTGIFESMYGGAGIEIAYKPFYKNFVVSFDAYQVKKRSYKQKFKFLDYETSTAHINFTYNFRPINIYANISYGRYLAKDDGFTYDFSRRTKSGFIAGFYFTRTDVPFELFGEGSFDKGFYFELPLSVFFSEPNRNSIKFGLRPLTRDGGAKLEISRPLKSILIDNNFNEINERWNEYY
jgi:hypothetical protein